jgi:stage II sporulation protein D
MAEEAAAHTRGELIVFDGTVIDAVFHADCGGYTSAADAVWHGPPLTYLQAVPDTFCARRPEAGWTWRVAAGDLRRALAASERTLVGNVTAIDVPDRDVAGRANTVSVTTGPRASRTMDGTEFRAAMLRVFGTRSLRSTRFTVTREGNDFVFSGRGNGHGVGLCQAGALARIRAGESAEDVIKYYFRGARVQRFQS